MSEPRSGSESDAESIASSATFASDAAEDPATPWEVDSPEIEPQDDYEAIVKFLTDWTFSHAFAFVKERSWQDRAGQTYKVKLKCDRACQGARRRLHRAQTRRSSFSHAAPACPFRLTVSALKTSAEKWTVVPNQLCLRHEGHPPSQQPIEHLHFRKHFLTDASRQYIEDLLGDKTVRIRTIHTRIQARYPEVKLRTKDLYNWRARIDRERKHGYSDIQRFIIWLKESPKVVFYCIKWEGELGDEDGYGQPGAMARTAGHINPHTGAGMTGSAATSLAIRRPCHVFWVLRKQEKQWKRFPYLASIDATYRTNYKHMPLVLGVVQTPERGVMPLFQAVLNNEGIDGYQWLVEAIQKALWKLEIPPPQASSSPTVTSSLLWL